MSQLSFLTGVNMSLPIAGWYPDPSGDKSKIRYWDGSKWTDQVQDNPDGVPAGTPAGAPGAPGVPAPGAPVPGAPGAPGAPAQGGYQPVQSMQQQQPQQPAPGMVPGMTPAPGGAAPYIYSVPQVPQKDNSGKAKAGFICAMIGLGISLLYWISGMLIGNSTTSVPAAFVALAGVYLVSHVLTIPSIILGAMGLKSSKRGMAITALVLGVLGVLAFVVLIILVGAILQSGIISF